MALIIFIIIHQLGQVYHVYPLLVNCIFKLAWLCISTEFRVCADFAEASEIGKISYAQRDMFERFTINN